MDQHDTGSYDPTSWLEDCMAAGPTEDTQDENREQSDSDDVENEPEDN